MRKALLFSAASVLLAGSAVAQNGTDSCTTPTAVGEGTFAFDTTTMVTDQEMTCLSAYSFSLDMFWVYTATVSGNVVIDTEGSTFDTQLGVYSGVDCTATCIDDDDDSGTGLLSSITLSGVTAGDTYVIQVGGWNGANGVGQLNIATFVDPCAGFMDDAFEENDDCSTAAAITDGTYPGLGIVDGDNDTFSFCLADGATVTADILFTDALTDLDLFLWDAADVNCNSGAPGTDLANGFSVTDNESVTYTNLTGADQNIIMEVTMFAPGTQACNNYDLILTGTGCGPGGVGTPFCDPMDPNSTTLSTTLTASSGSGVETGVLLEASNGVPAEFGYFLIGTGVSDPGLILSDGRLCLSVTGGNAFGRYNFGSTTNSIGAFDVAGNFQNLVGTATSNGGYGFDIPTNNPLGGMIMAGETWNFQLWHRDTPSGVGRSNFSNGLSITF